MWSDFLILDDLQVWQILLAFFGSIFASFIGTAVGGDGFIFLIVSSFLNLPSAKILGSYKWFAMINSFYAVFQYGKENASMAYKFFRFCMPHGLVLWIPAAYIGTILSEKYASSVLEYFLPFAAIFLAVFKTFFQSVKSKSKTKMQPWVFFYIIITILFFYIGFFGPGSGTFIIILSAYFLRSSLRNGSILSRHIDMIANIVSVTIFTISGNFYLDLIILMSLGGLIGSKISIEIVRKYGQNLLEIMLISMLYFIAIYYCWSLFLSSKNKCFWMENYSGKYEWIETKISDKNECFQMDGCKGGLGKGGGGCFKWAKNKEDEANSW